MSAEQSPQLNEFGRLVVLVNEHASQAGTKRTKADLAEIQDEFGNAVLILTTEDRPEKTQDKAAKTLRKGDVLVTSGGESTARDGACVLVRPDVNELEIALAAMPHGNGNNYPNSVREDRNIRPSEFIRTARIAEVSPISMQVTDAHGHERTHLAISCAGIGMTALLAQTLNKPSYRRGIWSSTEGMRFARDGTAILSSLFRSERVKIKLDGTDEEQLVTGIDLYNSEVVAKTGKPPVKLEEKRVHVTTVHSKLAVVSSFVQLCRGTLPPDYIEAGESRGLTVASNTLAHVDAEHFPVTEGSHFNIQPHDVSFLTLTSRPAVA